jgi:small subunit ribosomal protein S17
MAEDTPNETPDTTPAPEAAAPVEPVTPLTPKERKVASRARRGKRRGATPEERKEVRAKNPKVRLGVVVSDKADKTITVRIDTARRHRKYEKIVRSSTTLHAHDENNDAHAGDTVKIIEARPMSRLKRWNLVEVTERAK